MGVQFGGTRPGGCVASAQRDDQRNAAAAHRGDDRRFPCADARLAEREPAVAVAGGNVHAVIVKVSFNDTDLAANAHALINTLKKMKPSTAKGAYIKKVTMHASMSPGIPIDISHLEVVESEV